MTEDDDTKRNTYNHPYEPYQIQLDFMDAINEVLNKNYKIGIFESPTGTGKTLSLICSTISWLRQNKVKLESANGKLDNEDDTSDDDDEPSWVKESYAKIVRSEKSDAIEQYETHLTDMAKRNKTRHIAQIKERSFKRYKKVEVEIIDDTYLPDDYNPQESQTDSAVKTQKQKNDEVHDEIQSLLSKIDKRGNETSTLLDQKTKIFFTSRTHSQLNQFSEQLKLPKFPSSFSNIELERLKYLPLGSRKQLCINEDVSKIKDTSLMNEACLDLQKADSTKRCEFYPSHRQDEAQEKVKDFRDLVFSDIHDIEDLPALGHDIGTCPYYSIRKGIDYSEIITLPYQLLLQKSSRDTLGLSIKDSVVIIDEAHNLIDTITSIYSVNVEINDFKKCKESLKKYLSKFSRRLNGGNRVNLMKLIKIVDIIIKHCETQKILPGKVINVNDMFEGTTGDLLNVHTLEKYLKASRIAYKIESYMDKEDRSNTPALFKVVEFLQAVSNPSKEGKFFFDIKGPQQFVTYMLLDPSQIFKEIVEEARCVILAGGTMEPTEDYTNYLFPYVDTTKIKKFTCGHIIPEQNLKVFTLNRYENDDFEFSFEKRNNTAMIKSLGISLLRLIQRIPDGIVIFLPSYKYLSQIAQSWKSCEVWDEINKHKRIFSESSNNDVLSDYSEEIAKGNGGLLLSVVGGKLSEGINFSDELARAVMIVGLPFPNAFSGEIISKKKFIEDQVLKKTKDRKQALDATRTFYENICMRAVNQSVGRSIRHIKDYSTIYLIDKRYHNERIRNKLSDWIKQRVFETTGFEEILSQTDNFFQMKRG